MVVIEYEPLIKKLEEKVLTMGDWTDTQEFLDIVRNAKKITILSAARLQGEWVTHFDNLFTGESSIECSVCHEHQPMGIDDNYCPNCGARMKGANNDKEKL